MNADYGAKPITCPKPVLESVYGPPMLWNPVVKFDFQWAGRHPAHQQSSISYADPHQILLWRGILSGSVILHWI